MQNNDYTPNNKWQEKLILSISNDTKIYSLNLSWQLKRILTKHKNMCEEIEIVPRFSILDI